MRTWVVVTAWWWWCLAGVGHGCGFSSLQGAISTIFLCFCITEERLEIKKVYFRYDAGLQLEDLDEEADVVAFDRSYRYVCLAREGARSKGTQNERSSSIERQP